MMFNQGSLKSKLVLAALLVVSVSMQVVYGGPVVTTPSVSFTGATFTPALPTTVCRHNANYLLSGTLTGVYEADTETTTESNTKETLKAEDPTCSAPGANLFLAAADATVTGCDSYKTVTRTVISYSSKKVSADLLGATLYDSGYTFSGVPFTFSGPDDNTINVNSPPARTIMTATAQQVQTVKTYTGIKVYGNQNKACCTLMPLTPTTVVETTPFQVSKPVAWTANTNFDLVPPTVAFATNNGDGSIKAEYKKHDTVHILLRINDLPGGNQASIITTSLYKSGEPANALKTYSTAANSAAVSLFVQLPCGMDSSSDYYFVVQVSGLKDACGKDWAAADVSATSSTFKIAPTAEIQLESELHILDLATPIANDLNCYTALSVAKTGKVNPTPGSLMLFQVLHSHMPSLTSDTDNLCLGTDTQVPKIKGPLKTTVAAPKNWAFTGWTNGGKLYKAKVYLADENAAPEYASLGGPGMIDVTYLFPNGPLTADLALTASGQNQIEIDLQPILTKYFPDGMPVTQRIFIKYKLTYSASTVPAACTETPASTGITLPSETLLLGVSPVYKQAKIKYDTVCPVGDLLLNSCPVQKRLSRKLFEAY